MATASKFNLFVEDICKGTLSLGTDTIKVMLTNVAPVATNHVYADISANDLATGNGYTNGGGTCTGTGVSNASGTESFACNAFTWTSNTGNLGPFRYVTYYDSTPTTKTLICFFDYGSSITLNGVNGDTFTASPSGNVLFTLS